LGINDTDESTPDLEEALPRATNLTLATEDGIRSGNKEERQPDCLKLLDHPQRPEIQFRAALDGTIVRPVRRVGYEKGNTN